MFPNQRHICTINESKTEYEEPSNTPADLEDKKAFEKIKQNWNET